jgi:hypothetical protein
VLPDHPLGDVGEHAQQANHAARLQAAAAALRPPERIEILAERVWNDQVQMDRREYLRQRLADVGALHRAAEPAQRLEMELDDQLAQLADRRRRTALAKREVRR